MKTKYNQRALNEIINAGLDVDGDYGSLTKMAEDKFLVKLNAVLMKYHDKYVDFQPIGIRMSDSYTDKFTDWLFMKTPTNLFFIPISTKPASYLESEKAVAVLKEGFYPNCWQYLNGGWSGLPYFQQVKEFSIYRDNLKDLSITRTAPIVKGLFGINAHSWKNWLQNIVWYKSTNRNVALSEGCQVAKADDWQLFLNEINRKYVLGNLISYTLIHKQDFS